MDSKIERGEILKVLRGEKGVKIIEAEPLEHQGPQWSFTTNNGDLGLSGV